MLYFFFTDAAPAEIYSLSLHDALPISSPGVLPRAGSCAVHHSWWSRDRAAPAHRTDRKSTRLNSSHLGISYAVFCLKKKEDPIRTRSRSSDPQRAVHVQAPNGQEREQH